MCFVELRKCYEKCTRNWYFDSVKWKSIKYQFCTLQDNYNLLIKKLNLFHTGQKNNHDETSFFFPEIHFFLNKSVLPHFWTRPHQMYFIALGNKSNAAEYIEVLTTAFSDLGLFIKVLCKKGNKIELFEKFQKISNLTKNVKCDGATSLSAFELGFINYLNF